MRARATCGHECSSGGSPTRLSFCYQFCCKVQVPEYSLGSKIESIYNSNQNELLNKPIAAACERSFQQLPSIIILDPFRNLSDNGFQENQVKNVVGAGEMANAVGEDEMENVTVPSEMTNDDILGYAVPLNKMESMRQFCNKVLKPKSQGLFPGSHPVSLSRDNLRLLRQQYL
ncbi:hypothetical protein Tco_1034025 [Tanacetum coccineum]